MNNPSTNDGDSDHPGSDDAWKEFNLVNDWIRHADNKVGVTLAASGAVGVMLYNLVRALPKDVSGCAYIAPVACGVLLIFTVVFCTFALNPRVKATDSVDDPSTLTKRDHLYFGSVATWSREKYVEEFVNLVSNSDALLREISVQIHVNAKIATDKMAATKRAVYALSGGVAALAVTAVVVIVHV